MKILQQNLHKKLVQYIKKVLSKYTNMLIDEESIFTFNNN
jgi:hypothetical protein